MIALTWLYVPADRPDRVATALASAADVVVVDLEDAVAPAHKAAARADLAELLGPGALAAAGRGPDRVQVRVNALGGPWAAADHAALAALHPEIGARVPKVEGPADVRAVADAVGDRPLHLLVESALGVEECLAAARAHPRVAALGLGEADLRSDLGVDGDEGLAWSRARVVSAARAAGLPAPAMSVYPSVHDDDGLVRSCRAGRLLGFLGRAALHPRQLPLIVEAFLPTAEAVERARTVLEAVGAARAAGHGTVVLPDGRFLDVAMVEQARRTVELGARRG